MSKKRNRFSGFLRLAFVALAFVLYPYFVNQIPGLEELLQDVPPEIIIVGALVFAAIVAVAPYLIDDKETPAKDLWREFWQKNQDIIEQRLKSSLDQDCHIHIASIPSPEDLERPKRERNLSTVSPAKPTAKASQKAWKRWFQRGKTPREILDTLPRIATRRELQNFKTDKTTTLESNQSILEIFEAAKKRLLILGEPGSGKTTELLKLAKALGEVAENNPKEPIPVIFELSAWRGEPMLDWMAEEMMARYGSG